MASAWAPYSSAVLGLTTGGINLSSDTFVVTLISNSYVPAANSDATWSACSAYELPTAGGYTAGGIVLGVSDTFTSGTVTFGSSNPSWANFTAGPFRYGVIVRRAGATLVSTDKLLCFCDLTGAGSRTGGGYRYFINTSEILTVNAQ